MRVYQRGPWTGIEVKMEHTQPLCIEWLTNVSTSDLLPCTPLFGYNAMRVGGRRRPPVSEQVMRRLYFKYWVPFTINKRRILVLAIASYVAMC